MRILISIFLIALFLVSCVKKTSSDPVPALEFISAGNMYRTPSGNDTAVFTIGYEDGDGDLFVDEYSQGPNTVIKTLYYNADSSKFVRDKSVSNTIKQPDNGYYKGKAIKGQIIIPANEYRSNNSRKIIKFEFFMIDRKEHKSNIVSSPAYTLNF
jgi:hypothetical protein